MGLEPGRDQLILAGPGGLRGAIDSGRHVTSRSGDDCEHQPPGGQPPGGQAGDQPASDQPAGQNCADRQHPDDLPRSAELGGRAAGDVGGEQQDESHRQHLQDHLGVQEPA